MSLVTTETGVVPDAEAAEKRAEQIGANLDYAAISFEKAMEQMRAAINDRDDVAPWATAPRATTWPTGSAASWPG